MPRADSSEPSPWARPMPTTTPSAEATMPTTKASAITAARTWRREAPSARSSADSRVFWATTMANVL